jgi:hypothetical protein
MNLGVLGVRECSCADVPFQLEGLTGACRSISREKAPGKADSRSFRSFRSFGANTFAPDVL